MEEEKEYSLVKEIEAKNGREALEDELRDSKRRLKEEIVILKDERHELNMEMRQVKLNLAQVTTEIESAQNGADKLKEENASLHARLVLLQGLNEVTQGWEFKAHEAENELATYREGARLERDLIITTHADELKKVNEALKSAESEVSVLKSEIKILRGDIKGDQGPKLMKLRVQVKWLKEENEQLQRDAIRARDWGEDQVREAKESRAQLQSAKDMIAWAGGVLRQNDLPSSPLS